MQKYQFYALLLVFLHAAISAHAQKTTFQVCKVERTTDTLRETAFDKAMNDKYVKQPLQKEAFKLNDERYLIYEAQRALVIKNFPDKKQQEKELDKIKLGKAPAPGPAPTIVATSADHSPLVNTWNNAFYSAAERAYAEHRPLILSPDDVWLAICQGFATHVCQNSEALRQHFVSFEGKKVLNVDLSHWPTESEWPLMFEEFNRQIAMYTGPKIAETVNATFSTTTPDARIAYSVSMMSAMQNYFDFWGTVMCGIPEITLEGTPEDWAALEARAETLAQYDLEWWISDLRPVLHEFTAASKGQVNQEFWQQMVKFESKDLVCSSAPLLTGWIHRFFPYVNQDGRMTRNPLMGIHDLSPYFKEKKGHNGKIYKEYAGPMIEPKELPESTVSVPVCMNDNGVFHKMMVHAGFLGVKQDYTTKSVRPSIGWVVIDTNRKPDQEEMQRYADYQKEKLKGSAEVKKD